MSLRSHIVILVAAPLLAGCVVRNQPQATANSGRNTLAVGMTQADALSRLHDSGAVEVPKDIFPSASGWSVGARKECLFLSFTNGVLSGISIETDSDKPKMYRHFYATNSYSLR